MDSETAISKNLVALIAAVALLVIAVVVVVMASDDSDDPDRAVEPLGADADDADDADDDETSADETETDTDVDGTDDASDDPGGNQGGGGADGVEVASGADQRGSGGQAGTLAAGPRDGGVAGGETGGTPVDPASPVPGPPSPTTAPDAPLDPSREAWASDLQAGDCISAEDDAAYVGALTVSDCRAEHLSEVIGGYEWPDAEAYPGSSLMWDTAYDGCQLFYDSYVGGDFVDSPYDLSPIVPSAASWEFGDRAITCLLVSFDGSPLTDTVRDAGR